MRRNCVFIPHLQLVGLQLASAETMVDLLATFEIGDYELHLVGDISLWLRWS